MGFPTLMVGTSNPSRDAELHDACARMTEKEVAVKFGIRVATVKHARKRHIALREFDLFLTSHPNQRVRVAHVITAKPFTAVAIAAYRAYPMTLKKLEIPGWVLTDGETQRCDVTDLQQALGRNKGSRERVAARERLGLPA